MVARSNIDNSDKFPRVPDYSAGSFDFDGWHRLAVDDPGAYFDARRQVIDTFIASSPESAEALRTLQNQIDAMRACAGSPLKGVWQISGLLRDHVELLGHQLDVLKRETERLRLRGRGAA